MEGGLLFHHEIVNHEVAAFTYKKDNLWYHHCNRYLPMQLIYGEKTTESFPTFSFPDSFSISADPKHFSNAIGSLKLLHEIVIPYTE